MYHAGSTVSPYTFLLANSPSTVLTRSQLYCTVQDKPSVVCTVQFWMYYSSVRTNPGADCRLVMAGKTTFNLGKLD